MANINDNNREKYIELMAKHFKNTTSEDGLRKSIKGDPTILEEFVDWLEDGGEVSAI